MAATSICRAPLRVCQSIQAFSTSLPIRTFATTSSLAKMDTNRRSAREKAEKIKKRKKRNLYYKTYDLKEMDQFALCDAIRYIKAFEIGKDPTSSKYEAHIKMRTKKNGPVIRQNQMHLPYPVKTDLKFCYICPEDSKAYTDAKETGCDFVGEDEVIEQIKKGSISFDRCFAHPQSMQKIAKAGLPRVLGPKGLMPNPKNGTITQDPKTLFRELIGGALYKEKFGVVRMAVGQLGFSPEQLRDNLKVVLSRIKEDAAALPEEAVKTVNEVVLSSTNSPGFSLNGLFRSPTSPSTAELSV